MKASLDICAELCKVDPDANSFEHSRNQNMCKLLKEEQPTDTEQYEDYIFCAKPKLGRFLYGVRNWL